MPLAVSVVPSIGSTATSHSGPVPSPTCSPLKSIGALSFSPSPMTTTPSHADGGDQRAHRVDGDAVGAVLVAAADPAAGGHRGGLGDADQLQGEVAVGRLDRRRQGRGDAVVPGVSVIGAAPSSACALLSLDRSLATAARWTAIAAGARLGPQASLTRRCGGRVAAS